MGNEDDVQAGATGTHTCPVLGCGKDEPHAHDPKTQDQLHADRLFLAADGPLPDAVYLVVARCGGPVRYASWSRTHAVREKKRLLVEGDFVVVGPYVRSELSREASP